MLNSGKTSILCVVLAGVGANQLTEQRANAQSLVPAIFVANNGNLEGSVTSFTVNPNGTLNFVQKLTLDPTAVQGAAGTNAQAIALSPNGKYLVTGHGTNSSLWEQLNFFQVHEDATLTHIGVFLTEDSPISIDWVNDEYIVVTQTSGISGPFVLFKKFNPQVPSLTLVSYGSVGGNTFYVTVDRARQYVYAASSAQNQIKAFRLNPSGSVTTLSPALSTGFFPLGIGLSPDGSRIYWGSGISAGGHYVGGASIAASGHFEGLLPTSPYWSDGTSPKQVVITDDNQWAFVLHGTDSTIRGFAVDQNTGALTPTAGFFDVGNQGDSGFMRTMGNFLFVAKEWSTFQGLGQGVFSLTINPDGTLTLNGGLYSTEGKARDIAVWPGLPAPACPADFNLDRNVNVDDLVVLLGSWGSCGKAACPTDIAPPGQPAGDGQVNVDDLVSLLGVWGPCN